MTGWRSSRRARRSFLGAFSVGLLVVALSTAAPALAQKPYWHLSSGSAPSRLLPGGKGEVIVNATNLGDAIASGPITITDKLPSGLTARAVIGSLAEQTQELLECSVKSEREVSCVDHKPLEPMTGLKIAITVAVANEVVGDNEVEAAGGSAERATLDQPVTVSSEPAVFGVERYALTPEEEGGAPDKRAGSHPFQLTTTLSLNQTARQEPIALPQNFQFLLPPGLVGNPNVVKQCTELEFSTYENAQNLCKPDSVVGIAEVTIEEQNNFRGGPEALTVPIFNLKPAPGEPARFGFEAFKNPVVLDTSVRTGNDYGVTVTARSASQTAGFLSTVATIWGVPGDSRHNAERGWNCVAQPSGGSESPACQAQQKNEEKEQQEAREKLKEPAPFLSLPTVCSSQPLEAPMRAQSWKPGESYGSFVQSEFHETLEGCNELKLNPAFEVEPTTSAASTPTSLNSTVKLPQVETDTGLAESGIKETTIVFPQGLQLNPAAAGGLLACSAMQIGFLGSVGEEPMQTNNNRFSPGQANCPSQSKVGTVEVISPDLPPKQPLIGSLYLAAQDTNPFEAPLVIYLVAEDPVSGALVKLAGKTTPIEGTGQLVSTFENTPPLPFTELKIHLFGGAERGGGRASVSTPPLCGPYTSTTSFLPWSGKPPATPTASFSIGSGPGGGPCSSNPQPFAPGFSAGASNLQAGAFTPFTLALGFPDGSQALTGLATHLAPGMAAMLSSITPCSIEAADAARCGPESLVGRSTAFAGLGPEPFSLPGSVYVTGPYNGAPFGLSVATPAVAGPFNLGMVIANSTIEVDPTTAAVTVVARETRILDPRGATTIASTPLPTMIKGVPVALKAINVSVDRPSFQFNPTSCTKMAITGTLAGSQGAKVPVATAFQVANCASLPFGPKLTATAGGHASKVNGTNLNVTVTSAGLGQANIAKVFLQLPLALPSRLTTIQKACLDSVFNANPAACNEGSVIGHATVHTPALKGPLSGPAYLVSHGNVAFPDVEIVLQGEGILVILDGKTDIKKGITYSRFEAAPDAPFTTFETVLPAGPHSALTAYTPATPLNLCKTKLEMPTEITGQNGAVIKKITHIAAQGCGAVLSFKATALQRALKACRKKYKRNNKKRQKCEAGARKKYAPKKHSKAKKK